MPAGHNKARVGANAVQITHTDDESNVQGAPCSQALTAIAIRARTRLDDTKNNKSVTSFDGEFDNDFIVLLEKNVPRTARASSSAPRFTPTRGRRKRVSRDRCKHMCLGLLERQLSEPPQHCSTGLTECLESPRQQKTGVVEVHFQIGPQYNLRDIYWDCGGRKSSGIATSLSIV